MMTARRLGHQPVEKVAGIFNGDSRVWVILRQLPFVGVLFWMELNAGEWVDFVFHARDELEAAVVGVGGKHFPLLGQTVVGEIGRRDAPPEKQNGLLSEL